MRIRPKNFITGSSMAALGYLLLAGPVSAQSVGESSQRSKLDKLTRESGKDFSSDYDSEQVSAHKDAVSLFERYAKGGDNADLKDWALPALRHHLEMAESLKKKTEGST